MAAFSEENAATEILQKIRKNTAFFCAAEKPGAAASCLFKWNKAVDAAVGDGDARKADLPKNAHNVLSSAEDAVGAVGVRGKGDHPPAQHKVPFKDVPRGQKVARAARRGR